MTLFSIIIPCKYKSKLLIKTIIKLNNQIFNNFEIILLPDKPINKIELPKTKNLKIIPTGEVSPGIKRDIGSEYSIGDFLVFIDDDSYPEQTWLYNANKIINTNKKIICFGGSSILPSDDNFFSKICDYTFRISPSDISLRYRVDNKIKTKIVKDWPTVNLFIRKKNFKIINGFSNNYWPGEDTILCRKLFLKKIKILYFSNIPVFHYRRSNFKKYGTQISRYGIHRGHFARKFPENSGILYFTPVLFLFILFFLIVSGYLNFFIKVTIILSALSVYLFYINLKFFLIRGKLKHILFFNLSCLFTHFIYGIYFFKGFFSKRLPKFRSR